MDVDCEGCAGCCIDWRAVAPEGVDLDHERRGGLVPLDDAYNLVPLTSDEVRAFLEAGLGDAMTPRLFASAGRSELRDPERSEGSRVRERGAERPVSERSERDPRMRTATEGSRESSDEGEARSVAVDGHDLAAVGSRPAFFVGLRKPPKPVAPFGTDPAWLPTCVFLDPATLQCRLHGGPLYPDACATYPGDNLALDVETECERVEAAFGGRRLLDDDPGDADPLLGVGALGSTVFAHPDPDRLAGRVERIADGRPTAADRAEFVAVAAASRPGSLEVDEERYEAARRRALEADSWIGAAVEDWGVRADREAADPSLGEAVEERRGAPGTPGWE